MACISLTYGLMLGLSLFVRASLGFDCTFEHGMCGWEQSWDDSGSWIRQSGSSSWDSTGILSDKTPGSSTNYYCYSYGGSYSSSNAVLLSPIVEATDVRQFRWRFSFWYNMHGSDIGRLNVYKTPVNGRLSEGRVIFSRHGQQTSSSEWLEGEIYITDVASRFRIAFEATRQSSYWYRRGLIAIDDVTITGGSGFSCSFENGLCGWVQSSDDNADWTRHRGSTPTSYTGPAFDHTIGDYSGSYCYFHVADLPSHQNNNAVLLSPVISYDALQQPVQCFSFWYNMYGRDIGTLKVHKIPASGVLSDGQVIFTRSGQQNDARTWLAAELYIADFTSDFRIAFEAIHRNSYYRSRRGDIAIDDVQVKETRESYRFYLDDVVFGGKTPNKANFVPKLVDVHYGIDELRAGPRGRNFPNNGGCFGGNCISSLHERP